VKLARTLRGRLALFYAALMVVVLGAFAGTVWLIIEAQEASEPPEVAKLEGPDYTSERVLLALLAALPVAAAVAVGGAVVISRRGLRPIDDVVAVTARIRAEDLRERIPERPEAVAEVARLVTAVNGMLDRLERSVDGMRRFTADASHELRSPLAVLMGELELALRRPRSPEELRGTVETTLEELGRLQRLVESLLTLARSDASGLPTAAVDVDLVELARGAVDPYEALLSARNVALEWDAPKPVAARADPLWAGRVIANLADNACKFTPAGGTVTVRVRADGERARVEVCDSGPGVAEADRERIFERFYRGEAARAGSEGFGLGLALGREIARALGGELAATSSQAGGHFVLTLPAR
jgi:two-component system OmpR family sensor kinase